MVNNKTFKVFDIESNNWNEIYAIGIYDGINDPIIKTNSLIKDRVIKNNEYIEFLFDNLNNNDIVYAHNGGKFDFLFIIDYLNTYKASAEIIKLINSSILYMKVKYKDKIITFKDSFHILPSSLLRLTNDFDVVHKKRELDYDLGLKDKNFKDYFNNDLKGLYEVLKLSGLTDRLTLASNSMKQFKNIYNKKFSRNNDNLDNFFRKSYVGGRVEVIKHRGYELNYYDVNSLYPFVMKYNKYPLPIKDNTELTHSFNNDKIGIYECDVITPKIHIPILPIKHDNKLIFPIGTFSGTFCSPEIKLALKKGYKIKVKYGYVFKECDKIFNEYVNYWYNIKKSSKGSKKAIAKLMLNSLYGKFGQKREFKDINYISKEDYLIQKPKAVLSIGSLNFERKTTHDFYSDFMHSEIAALTTSYARVYLYELMESVGLNNIYYYDTDSIITSGLAKTSDELGDLKNEASISEFIALSPKMYAYKTTDNKVVIKSKGFKVDKLTFNDFERAYNGDYKGLSSKFDKIASFKESLKKGHTTFTDLKTIERHVLNIDYKRVRLQDGNTEPICLDI